MKTMVMVVTAFVMVGGMSLAYAGNIDKGKVLFESPILGGGTTGKTCKTCHEGGKKFGSDLFDRKHLTVMGKSVNSVAGIVNFCIERPLGGSAIDPKGEDMADLTSYMKTLLAK